MTILYSAILSLLTIFATFFVPFTNAPAVDVPENDFVPVMRFVATSDTHIMALGDKGCQRIVKMIKSAYDIAENDSDYNALDAVVFSGDITDDGTFTAFSAFVATTDKVIKGDTQRLALVAKSHDSSTYDEKALSMFTDLTGQETDFHRVINGYHFIGISRSPEAGVHYTEEQVKWLDAELAKAVEDAPMQPVFVFQHEHVLNTVFGSYSYDGWGMSTFSDVLNKYPQVIHVSGHSHYPSNDPRSIWQGSFTAIGDGGLAYYEFTVDSETSVHPEGYKAMTQALLFEVDKDNRVLIKVLDVDAGEIVAEYLVDNVTDTVKDKYSHDVRRAASSAPVFAENAKLSVNKKLGKFTVIVPQAATGEDNEVYLYRIFINDKNGNTVYTAWELSQYYYADVPDTISFESISLDGGDYEISVYAQDVWGNQSAPLTVSVTA